MDGLAVGWCLNWVLSSGSPLSPHLLYTWAGGAYCKGKSEGVGGGLAGWMSCWSWLIHTCTYEATGVFLKGLHLLFGGRWNKARCRGHSTCLRHDKNQAGRSKDCRSVRSPLSLDATNATNLRPLPALGWKKKRHRGSEAKKTSWGGLFIQEASSII